MKIEFTFFKKVIKPFLCFLTAFFLLVPGQQSLAQTQ